MKNQRILTILIKVLIVGFVSILLLLPLHAFLSTWGGTAVGPLLAWKSWKEILLLGLGIIAGIYCIARPDVLKTLWDRWINRVVLFYAIFIVVYALTSNASSEAAVAGLLMNLRFLAMFLLAQLIVASNDSWVQKLKTWGSPWLLTTAIVISVLAILQVSVLPNDFLAKFGYDSLKTIPPYLLVDDNPDTPRAFATLRGPNELGSYLILVLTLAAALVVKQRRNLLAGAALGLGFVALFLSHSRSAWLGTTVALSVLAVLSFRKEQLVKLVKWGSIPAIVVGAMLLWLTTTVPSVRLAIFHSSPGDPSLLEGSSAQHWHSTAAGAVDALQHPFGQGVGVAGPASYYNTNDSPKIAENYFVQIAQEIGIAGLGLFIAINVALAVALWRQPQELWPRLLIASFAGLTFINMFLHTWVDDPTAMTWWAVVGLWAFSPQPLRSSKKM
ncbi:MAG: O-antigen ligase family protein [Candidatus Saccharimonadales bacterium]